MKAFLTNLGMITGAIFGALTIVDWLLSENQKRWLKSRAEDAWLFMAAQSVKKFISSMRSRGFRLVAVCLAYWSLLVPALLLRGEPGSPNWFAMLTGRYFAAFGSKNPTPEWVDIVILTTSAVLVHFIVFPRLVNWTLRRPTLWSYFARCCAVAVSAFPLQMVAGMSSVFLLVPLQFVADIDASLAITQFMTGLITTPCLLIGMIFFSILVLAIDWFVICAAFIALLRVLQFMLFRVIENQKGIVMGASGLLVGIGAIIKAISL